MPTVKEILEKYREDECELVRKYLALNGYDGLYRCGSETCGCGLKSFAPCGEPDKECEAAFQWVCPDCVESVDCILGDDWDEGCFKTYKQRDAKTKWEGRGDELQISP